MDIAFALVHVALDIKVRDSANGSIKSRSFLLGVCDFAIPGGALEEDEAEAEFPLGLVLDHSMDMIVDQIVICGKYPWIVR
ncbi:hypothetical protein BGZ73_003957 [Actinomortierella ambigua]|nr:hypothetical protein BGZ73_003957 [Actinomortierella ambigua]